jgi:uncharacterized glyoxalase superfamily protein PhnB
MNKSFKPEGYNSLSPYLVVENAQKLVDLLKSIFNATELRRFDRDDGTIMHLELKIDDSVIMIGDSSKEFPPNTTMMHVYVPDVIKTFNTAIENGCEEIEKPITKPGDTDMRGGFMDFAGNYWAVGTQN